MKNRWGWPGLALLLLCLSGCAPLVPQTLALRADWPADVPERVELAQVPHFPQQDLQGAPAALAAALTYSGSVVHLGTLADELALADDRPGSLPLELMALPRQYGRVSYRLAPRYADLLREVAAGHPVIVQQDLGALGTQWHYAVVNGFDQGTGTVFLRSGSQPWRRMSFGAFERSWQPRHWAMVVLPPDSIAATATEERWLDALLSLARSGDVNAAVDAYTAALKRWPDSLPAAVGLANQLHARGSLDQAAAVLRDALQRNPHSGVVLNSLAQTLSDQGRHAEALALIQHAGDPAGPFASEVRATKQRIEERLRR